MTAQKLDYLQQYKEAGSDIYYVLRQVPEPKQIPYLALHAYATELYKISENYQEIKIAQQKLAWWADEIKRLYNGQASHPITKALSAYVESYDIKAIELLAMLEGALLSTNTQIFATESELRQHYQHLGGIIMSLKAKVLLPEIKNKLKLTHELGVNYEVLRHLNEFPKFLQRQHLYLPLSLFQMHYVDPQPILQNKNLENLKPLLQAEFNTAKAATKKIKVGLSKNERAALRPLFLELGLKIKQLDKTAAQAWRIFDYRLELSPVIKFFYTEFAK